MHLSRQQYQTIMQTYESARQRNLATEIERKSEVHDQIPEIAQIDAEIAHRKITSAKYRISHPEIAEELHAISDISELIAQKTQLLTEHRYPADYLAPLYTCHDCKDSGYIGTKKCHCFQKKIRSLLIEESNLRSCLFEDNFSKFQLDYYSREIPEGKKLSPYDNMQAVLQKTHSFMECFAAQKSQNLMIYGNAGVGKTFLSHCIGAELLSRQTQVVYLTAYQLFEQLADYTFRRDEYDGLAPALIFDADLLIIDDLGTEVGNTFTNSQLFLVINERQLRHKSTIISTNLSLKEITSTYTERVFSRIIESYELLQIYGEDIRIKKALAKSIH